MLARGVFLDAAWAFLIMSQTFTGTVTAELLSSSSSVLATATSNVVSASTASFSLATAVVSGVTASTATFGARVTYVQSVFIVSTKAARALLSL